MYPRINICGYPQIFTDMDRIRIWLCRIKQIRIACCGRCLPDSLKPDSSKPDSPKLGFRVRVYG